MKEDGSRLLPKAKKVLEELGENIKLARLRRKLRAQIVAERSGISRSTLLRVEQGTGSASIATYLKILLVLGLENDLLLVGRDDTLGRKIEDARLLVKERAPKRKKPKHNNE